MTDTEKRAKALPKVPEVRKKFLEKFNVIWEMSLTEAEPGTLIQFEPIPKDWIQYHLKQAVPLGSILDDTYDDADVKWVKTSDAFILNVLCAFRTQGDVEKSVNLIDEVLKFRAKYKLSSMKESDLNPALLQKKPIFIQGVDKNGLKLLFIRVAAAKKGEFALEEVKKVIAFNFNKHYMSEPEHKVVCVFDCTDAGVSNFDTDMSKFVIACNDTYFPEVSDYALMFKLGKTLEVVWAVIKTFMNAEQTKKTHVVSRSNVTDYIPEDQLLPHMKKDKK